MESTWITPSSQTTAIALAVNHLIDDGGGLEEVLRELIHDAGLNEGLVAGVGDQCRREGWDLAAETIVLALRTGVFHSPLI